MENVNLLNLPPSEKLVAILDGELNQQEAGNFFQELYQSQDLQDQFFDMINIKNNFRGGGGITPPDNLKSNILKGIGLAAASTITYQTVATNNAMSWGSAMIQTLGSKISIALMSGLMASLVTIGVMNYNSNQEINSNNQKSEFTQNQFDNNTNNQNSNNQNNQNRYFQNQNIAILGGEEVNNELENGKSNGNGDKTQLSNSKIPNSKISSTRTISKKLTRNNINFKNTNNLNNNLDKNDNFEINNFSNNFSINKSNNSSNSNSNNIVINEDDDNYDKNSLVPGAVPESKYKVEIINKSSDSKQNEISNQNSSEIKNATIKNDPNSDLDFYNPESIKSKYIEEESKMSFHFRNFSAKALNDLDIPQMNNPIINNIGAGILYELNEKWSFGVEIGQENFEQEFKANNGTNEINLQQNHLAFWGGALVRYNFNNNKIKSEFNPYINMLVGSTDIGPLVKPSIGITYNISNDFAVFGAGEFTAMYSKYNSIWYNSQKYGFTYGFILKF